MLDLETRNRLRYPFPALANPNMKEMQDHTDRMWIDGEWSGFVPPDVAERFKKTRTAYMTSYFFPMATWERLVPLARMMLFSLYQDDIYERAHPDQVRRVREGTMAVARGQATAGDVGVMLGPQIQTLRDELLRFLPVESVTRWADDLDLYFEGLEAETRHLFAGTIPDVAEYLWIRERALMLHPFFSLKEIETQVVLPDHIHDHPVMKRLKSLAVRITGWFNEFQSYDKDVHTGMADLNLINIVQHRNEYSLNEAREWVFSLHERELAEFVHLQRNLPDLDEWNDAVANHVHHISFVISGWRSVDALISRYDSDAYIDKELLKASVRVPIPITPTPRERYRP